MATSDNGSEKLPIKMLNDRILVSIDRGEGTDLLFGLKNGTVLNVERFF